MAEKKMMSSSDFKKYEEVTPIANFLLAEVIEKEPTRLLESGLLVNEENVTNNRPYLVVRKVSKAIAGTTLNIDEGDIIELGGGHISYFYGQNSERFALINAGTVAGVYKKKKE